MTIFKILPIICRKTGSLPVPILWGLAVFLLLPHYSLAQSEKPRLIIDSGGHMAPVSALFFSPDGRRLYSVSQDKTVRVWDVETGGMVRVLRGQIGPGHQGKLYAAALSRDGKTLALGGFLGREKGEDRKKVGDIRLLDARSGAVKSLLRGHGNVIHGLAFSQDGGRLISGGADKTARIWDVASGQTLQMLKGHTRTILTVDISPDGTRAVTGGEDKTLRLWDAKSGKVVQRFRGHWGDVEAVMFIAGARQILSAGRDRSIRLWEARSGRLIKTVARTARGILSLAIGRDGSQAVAGTTSGAGREQTKVFRIPSGRRVATFKKHDGSVTAAAFSPDGITAATAGGTKNQIYLWRLKNARLLKQLSGRGGPVVSVGFARDGSAIAWGKTFEKDDTLSGNGYLEQIFRLREGGRFAPKMGGEVEDESVFLKGIEARGALSIRTGSGLPAKIFEVYFRGESLKAMFPGSWPSGPLHRSLTLTPSGESVISGRSNGVLTLYERSGVGGLGWKGRNIAGHTADVLAVAPSPDGRWLVSGSADQTVRLWDIVSGKTLITIFHGDDNEWAAWTPEGFYMASPKGDRYVGWQVNRGYGKRAGYFRASQFRRYLYRPDIIKETLRLSSSAQAVKNAGLEDVTAAALIERAPVDIRIGSVKVFKGGRAEMTVKLGENTTTAPERVTLYVNGAQVLTEAQRRLEGVKPGDTLRYRFKLPDKRNRIRVLMENKWAETSDETVVDNPHWRDSGPRGTLYVTAIGINRYPQLAPEQQLATPNVDAEAIARRFTKLKGVLYRDVVVTLLTDTGGGASGTGGITTARVEQTLLRQAAKARPGDTSLIFLAGHGVTDAKGSYHFVTADTVLNTTQGAGIGLKAGTSFDWGRLHKVLDRTMGRRIVMVDTCQAGSVLTATKIDIRRLVKDIHDVNAIIYSGSSRQQSALETSKGGVFTQAMLAGMDGKAAYRGKDLPFSALRKYVDAEVPRLNRAIVADLFRSVTVVQRERAKNDNAVQPSAAAAKDDSVQEPVAVVPKDMENFVIFRRLRPGPSAGRPHAKSQN